jgi:predicted nucleic acid-binding protein
MATNLATRRPGQRQSRVGAGSQRPTPGPVVVDASVWVARFIPSDAFHATSRAWLAAHIAAKRTLISPALLLPELAGSVARVLNDSSAGLRAARLVTRLSIVRLVPLDAALSRRAFEAAANDRLRGADAVYVALARQLRVPLVSWDKEQLSRAGAITP